MGCKKQGAKNQGHCYSKREEAALSLLFLNNNGPVVSTLLFATFFLKFQTLKKYQADLINSVVGAD